MDELTLEQRRKLAKFMEERIEQMMLDALTGQRPEDRQAMQDLRARARVLGIINVDTP